MRLRLLAGLALVAVSVAVPSAPGSATPVVSSFTVTAHADSIGLEVIDPNVPLFPDGEITYATPGTAQAAVDSLGESTAFASSPYPGDSIAGLPGLVNGIGATYGLPALPAYPFIVNTSYPDAPTAHLVDGVLDLQSASSANSSTAAAVTGLSGVAATPKVLSVTADASTNVDPSTGIMTATADDDTDGLAVGSMLVISDISSHATLRRVPGQAPVEHTSFSVGSVTVAGLTVGFTDKGFQIGPAALPTLTPAVLNGLLSRAGITLAYLPSTATADGIDSAGLQISVAQNVPGQGEVKVIVTLGHVAVSALAVVAGPLLPSTSPSSIQPPPSSGGSAVGGQPQGPSAAVAPGAAPGAVPGVGPPPASASTGPPGRPPPLAVSAVPAATELANPFVGNPSDRIFSVFALAAVLLLAIAAWRRRRHCDGPPSVLRLGPPPSG